MLDETKNTSTSYSKQELLFVINQFKEKNARKDTQIEKMRKKICELENAIQEDS